VTEGFIVWWMLTGQQPWWRFRPDGRQFGIVMPDRWDDVYVPLTGTTFPG
jgi:hypothetical protein